MHVAHGQTGLHGRHRELRDNFTRLLVVGIEQWIRAIAGEKQCFGDEQSDVSRGTGLRNVQSLKSRIAFDIRGCVTIGDLPCDVPLVHIVSRDPAVGRLDQAQTLDGRQLSAAASAIVGRAIGS